MVMKDANKGSVETISKETNLSSNRFVRMLFIVTGSVFVGLGTLGVILPLLPSTPFFLLGAGCYARGSKRFYIWLLTNRYFGEYIRDWRENNGIPFRSKLWVTFVLVTTLCVTAYLMSPVLYVQLLLVTVGIGVSWYVWRLPTKEEDRDG